VVRLAARAVQQLVEAVAQHQARALAARVEQVGRPVGDAVAVDQQVVFDGDVARQGLGEADVQQVDERVLADRDDLAIHRGRAVNHELRLQRLAADQPDGQALRLQAAQYRASKNEGQTGGGH